MLVRGIDEVALIGDLVNAAGSEILETLRAPYRPNLITAWSREDVARHALIPLLSERSTIEGRTTAYVCRNFACRLPVTTAAETAAALKGT